MNTISEQKISHVTNMYVTADLYQARPDKTKIFWHYEINMLLIVYEYTLFVCIWRRHLKLYLRKWSLIQISLKKHFLHITWMGDSRKYPYHTMGGILEFRGRGGVSWTGIPKTWGGNAVWNSKGMGGCFSSEFSEFPEERRRKLRLKSLTC